MCVIPAYFGNRKHPFPICLYIHCTQAVGLVPPHPETRREQAGKGEKQLFFILLHSEYPGTFIS